MKKINLLPKEYVFKLQLYRILRKAIAVTAVVFFVSTLVVYVLGATIGNLNLLIFQVDEEYNSHIFLESEMIADKLKQLNDSIAQNALALDSVQIVSDLNIEHIEKILKEQSSGFVINEIYIDRKSSTITLQAISYNRLNIITFIDRIVALDIFKVHELVEMRNIEDSVTNLTIFLAY